MIEAVGLEKRFGDVTAVAGVDFSIRRAEAFGLLGPNGAGKTTTILMLVGAVAPDAGRVTIDGAVAGRDTAVRRRVGIAPQELAIYDELTGEENLTFFARVWGLRGRRLRERVDWALAFAGLIDRRKHRVGTYSGGMKRRLNLACAVVHEPAVLLCDEPTVGVDPQSRNHIFESIEQLKAGGCTLLYTTHYMEEAERLCDRVAIVDRGRILAVDTVEGLVAEHGGTSVVTAELAEAPEDPAALPGELDGLSLRIEAADPLAAVAALGRTGAAITRLRVDKPDLERVFLRLTGRTLRD